MSPDPTKPTATNDPKKTRELWPIFLERLIDPVTWFTGLLVIVGGLQIWTVIRQNDIMVRQSGIMNAQGLVSTTILEVTKITERAYVDISHNQPGLDLSHGDIRFSIAIKNHGRTPANVARAQMFLGLGESIADLPAIPLYGTPPTNDTSVFFLMPNEIFHQWELRPQFSPDIMQMISSGQRILWLIGYIDYADRFDRPHRSGYARRYIPTPLPGTTNNLVFELTPGYNYDRELEN